MQSLPAVGTEVVVRRERWRVERTLRHGAFVEVDATRLSCESPDRVTFFAPFDRIHISPQRLRPRRVRPQRWRAVVRHALATAESFTLPLAAYAAAIELMPHQLEPCLAMLSGIRRLLIADDVGLGKTVEAGLIVAEAMRRGDARRVLIVAPATLCGQWRHELRSRFGLDAVVVDAESLRRAALDLPRDVNPWSVDGVHLTSIDFVKQPHVLAALPEAPWDIVVIDEAHAVGGDSTRHAAADAIASRARSVVLLTATPHSGDEAAARRLMRLGALGEGGEGGEEDSLGAVGESGADGEREREREGGEDDGLMVFRRMRLDIGPGPLRRVRRVRVRLTSAETRALDLVGRFVRVARDAASSNTRDATDLLLSIVGKRALSTFRALLLTVDRRLAFLDGGGAADDTSQMWLGFGDAGDPGDASDAGDAGDAWVSARIGLPIERERSWLRRLRGLAATAATRESKIARLAALVGRTTEPVIVFTEFRDSLAVAAAALGDVATVSVAHGALAARALAEALEAFQSGRSRVLVATDVASQGLNLQQRCRWVIHLDRPWNPVRLEQRAGRVDRLGQARDVHLTELMTSHDREFELAERVGRRAQAAATSAWLRPCVRWQVRGAAAARVLGARRRLGAAWRGPAASGRPIAAKRRSRDRENRDRELLRNNSRSRFSGFARAIWRTEIRDRDGRIREAVFTDTASRIDARLRRLARLERERAGRQEAVERALGARLNRRVLTQLTLPGTSAPAPAAPPAPALAAPAPTAPAPTAPAPLLTPSAPRLFAIELD